MSSLEACVKDVDPGVRIAALSVATASAQGPKLAQC